MILCGFPKGKHTFCWGKFGGMDQIILYNCLEKVKQKPESENIAEKKNIGSKDYFSFGNIAGRCYCRFRMIYRRVFPFKHGNFEVSGC